MGTSTLRRVELQVTGVAGSPYYIVGYFTADSGTTQQVIDAWMTFVIGGTSGTTGGAPAGATYSCGPDVRLVDPATGNPVGNETATARAVTGTNTGDLLPPANQLLVRWHTGNYVGGREVRGRTNIPNQFEVDNTQLGNVAGTLTSAFNSRASALIGDANSVFVIWSKKNGVWFAASNGSAWSKWAVLRSRRD